MWLRQSTASQEILLGAFLDSTDGNTAETGLTIANTDIKLWKEGATTEANKNSGGATHIASGRYYAVLDATDSNTLGKLEINVHVSGALAVRREFMVVPANVYDSLVLGTDTLDSAAIEWNGVALGTTNPLPNAAADAAGGLPVSDVGGLDLDNEANTAFFTSSAQLVDDVWNEALSGHTTAGSSGKAIADIEIDTDELQTNQGNWLTATGFATETKQDATDIVIDDIPTTAEFEARTPTAAQLLYITRHAATALPVTFTGGTTTTAVLGNVDGSAASTTDDVYNSRLLVFNAGTLDVQVCQIADYDGGTKTATISAVTTAVTSGHTAVLV